MHWVIFHLNCILEVDFFWGGVVTNDLVGLTVSFIRFCTVLNLHVVVKIFFLSTHRAKIVSCIIYATR